MNLADHRGFKGMNDAAEGLQLITRLESLGVAQVRLLLQTDGFPHTHKPAILKWLTEKDEEERKRHEASQIDQNKLASSTHLAAWVAAIAAIVSVVISMLAWLRP
jgi:hypothetical protein